MKRTAVVLAVIGFATAAAVIVAANDVRHPECSAGNPPTPHWFYVLFAVLSPLSVLAIFGAVLAAGRVKGWGTAGRAFAAFAGAVVWAAVGFYIVAALLIGDCLS